MATKPLATSALNSRRAEICRTAARLFRERGFDASSVSEIARALKMTKAGLYHYFTSKEELLLEIMLFGLDTVCDEVITPTQSIRDPEERLRQIVMRHAQITTRAEGSVAQIEEVRALMAKQVDAQVELTRAAGMEKARVRAALDFFGPGHARSGGAQQPARLVRLK